MPMYHELNEEEHSLVKLFRSLSDDDRAAARSYVAALSTRAAGVTEARVPSDTPSRVTMATRGCVEAGKVAFVKGVATGESSLVFRDAWHR